MLLIKEIQLQGATGADEFIELLNTSHAPLDIGGWTIVTRGSGLGGDQALFTFPPGTVLAPGSSLLLASDGYDGEVPADFTYAGGEGGRLSNVAGGLGVRAGPAGGDTPLIDAMVWGSVDPSHLFRNLDVGNAPVPAADRSIERTSDSPHAGFVVNTTPTPTGAEDAPAVAVSPFQRSGDEVFVGGGPAEFVSTNSDVVGLAGGGFAVARFDTDTSRLTLHVYGPDGTPISGDVAPQVQSIGLPVELVPLAGGGFALCYTPVVDGNLRACVQIYGDDGQPIGDLVTVHPSSLRQLEAGIEPLEGGGFVVTWQEGLDWQDADGDSTAVMARVFGAEHQPAGDAFIVHTTTAGSQYVSRVAAALEGGGFVVLWGDSAAGAHNSYVPDTLRIRVFDAEGEAVTAELVVDPATSGDQVRPAVTALDGGGFLVTWTYTTDDDVTDWGPAKGQIYDASGAPVGGVLDLASGDPTGFRVIALEGGGFVTAWDGPTDEPNRPTDRGDEVYIRVHDAAGEPTGPATIVNTDRVGHQWTPEITALADGGYVVVWIDEGAVKAQVFDANGAHLGPEMLVNTTAAEYRLWPKVRALDTGGFVVSWSDQIYDVVNSTYLVRAQAFEPLLTAAEQAPLDLKGRGFSIMKPGDEVLTVTLSTDYGVLEVEAGTSGATVAGSGTDTVTLTGTAAQISHLLGEDGASVARLVSDSDAPPAGATVTLRAEGAGGAAETTATVRVLVEEDGPLAEVANAPVALNEGGTTVLTPEDLSYADPDLLPGALVYTLEAAPAHGVLMLDGVALDAGDSFTQADIDAGRVAYRHDASETTADQFQFFVTDSEGGVLAGRALSFAINPMDDMPSVPDLRPDSDTGSSNADDVTSDSTPILTGTGPVNSVIRIYEGGVLVAEGMSDADGNWSITLPEQSEGIHRYEARAVDGEGNETSFQPRMLPAGGEVQVNTYTTGYQGEPQVTALAGGGYVITWISQGEGDPAYDVRAQLYDASGAPVGGEFLANTHTAGHQQTQAVTALDDGGFVVVWQSGGGQDGSSYGVYGQRYDASGTPSGGEFQVNTYTAGDQATARVDALEGGGFVVTWHSSLQDGDGNGVFARVYDASGAPTTGDVQVNTYTTGAQEVSEVTALEGGGFVVVWRSNGQDGSNYGVYGQVFDADGAPSGGEFRVNTYTTGQQLAPKVTALEGGGFVVTWQSSGQDGFANGIYGQLYDSSGAASGGEFRINSYTPDSQNSAQVTALEGGGFIVAWTSGGQDGSANGVYAQLYDASGAPSGGEFRVNTHTTNDQYGPQVSALEGGGFVVVWRSEAQDGDGGGVYAQVYDAAGAPTGGELQLNTHTAGSQELHQVTGLEGGGFVVAWRSFGQDGSTFSVHAQHYAPESGMLEVTVDTTAPDAPSAPDLSPASDTGASDSDDLTNDSTPTLTGTGPADTLIRIYEGGTVVAEGVSDGDGNWSITLPEQAEGAHSYEARSVDDAGNEAVLPRLVASGGEFPLNTTTFQQQHTPQIAALADGGYVVTWTSLVQDGDLDGVYGQRFNADGEPVGGEFRANSTTTDRQQDSSVTALEDGGFVVTWYGRGTGDSSGIFARRYDADGSPTGGEFRVNSASGIQVFPHVAALEGGGFVIAWQDDGHGNGEEIYGRIYGADGVGGAQFRLNSQVSGDQGQPSLAGLAGGGFVALWESGSSDEIRARVFDETGAPLGSDFRVSTHTSDIQADGRVTALADGGFVIVWASYGPEGPDSSYGIYGQRYDASGAPTGGEFHVNTYIANAQSHPHVVALPDGGFLVAWDSVDQDGSSRGVYAQRYGADGAPLGGEFQVNSTTDGYQAFPQFAVLADGTLQAVWTGEDSYAYGIQGQHFTWEPWTLDLVVDTTAPAAPTIDLDAASDTGADEADDLTNDTTPTLTGTAEAGATIEILRDGVVVDSVTADGDGDWTWTSAELVDGVWAFAARVTDGAGNSSESGLTVTVDTIAPDAPSLPDLHADSDSGDSDSDDLTGDSTPTLTGTGPADTLIRIYDGATLVAEGMSDGDGDWSITLPAQADGEHAYTARAVDEAGNESADSAPLEVVADTTAPADSGSGTPTIDEDGSVSLDGWLLQADDVDAAVTYEVVGITNGALYLNGVLQEAGDVFSQADVDAGLVTFTHDDSETLTGGFSFTTRDQHGNESSVQTFEIAVNPVNDAPQVGGIADVGPFLEDTVNAAPRLMGLTVTVADPEGNFDGGTLTLSGLLAEDRVSLRDEGTGPGQVGLSGADVTYGGVVIGTLAGGVGGTLTITFNAAAGTAALNAVIQNLTYANVSDTPTASRDLTLNVTDDEGEDLDDAAVITLTVESENDVPTLTGLTTSISFDETDVNAGPQLLDADVVFADGDGNLDGGNLTLSGVRNEDRISVRDEGSGAGQIGFDAGTGEVSYGGVVIGTLAGGAGTTLTITFNAAATAAGIDALVQNLTYANVSNTPTPSRDLFLNITDADGADLIGARTFELADPVANPLPYDLGDRVAPALVDLDGDGDLDLVTGDASGRLLAFENVRGDFLPLDDDPFSGIDVGDDSTPAFADVDGDGDLDLVVGELFGGLRTFENDGGVFTEMAGAGNPFADIDPRLLAMPSFADIDGDGDLDLVVGENSGVLRAFRNDSGAFTELVGAANPFAGVDMGSASTAAFLDLDGDGDLDLVGGQFSGTLLAFENDRGTFADWSGVNPFDGIDMGDARRPTFGDIDGDGDLDLLVGRNDGTFDLILNTTSRGHRITVEVIPDSDEPVLSGLDGLVSFDENAVNAAPALLDAEVTFDDLEQNFDGGVLTLSGLLGEDRASVRNEGTAPGQIGLSGSDVTFGGVVIGTLAGGVGATLTITFNAAATAAAIEAVIQNLTYANVSDTPTASRDLLLNVTDATGADLGPAPVRGSFVEADAAANPFDGLDVRDRSMAAFIDLDGDGDLDLVTSSGSGPTTGTLRAFDNDGGVFTELIGAASPFNGLLLGNSSGPAFADVDGDGDLDLVIGTMDATLRTFDNDGGVFSELVGAANPFDGVALGGSNARPAFVDLDGDGDLDLAVGGNEGRLRAFANDGGAFTELVDGANPFDGIDVGFSSAPAFVDLDGDGDLDLVVGEASGTLQTFENDGGVFTQLSGAANPFDGIDVGFFAAASFVDVDGDGDLDAVVGEDGGTLRTFLNTTPHGRIVTVTVNAETDDFAGDSDDNVVTGSAGDDTIDGLDGDDLLAGGGGNDVLNGGDGTDTADYTGAASGVAVRLFAGRTTNDGDSGSDTLVSVENVTGSSFDDTLLGSAGANVLRGGAGQDYLMGMDGNDVLFGGSGVSNQLQGGAGDDDYHVDANDTLLEFAGEGHDRVFTTQGRLVLAANVEDLTYVGAGAFTGVGNAADNTMIGGAGDDTLSGHGGDDLLAGGDGSDTADYSLASSGVFAMLDVRFASDGDGGTDTLDSIENLRGSAFHDLLYGSAGDNVLDGGAGDDLLVGRGGNDTLRGGAGLDLVDYTDAGAGVFVKLNAGWASDGDGGTDTLISIEDASGSLHDDILLGSAADNALYGLDGSDYLAGLDGNDELWGGAGAPNHLQGGLGDDRYYVEANDTLVEFADEGYDSVATTLNRYTLRANFEELTFSGVGDFIGTGNDLNNFIYGGASDDTLSGRGGNDTLHGGGGVDLADYSDATSGVVANLNTGRASDGAGGTDTLILIEDVNGSRHDDVLIGGAADNALYGLDGSDYLVGLAGDDLLSGGAGAPNQLQGGLGDDRYYVEANDTLIEFEDEGFDSVATTLNSYTLRAHFEELAFDGAGNFVGTGNDLDNSIYGGEGDDVLTGGGGDDILVGSSSCGCGEPGFDTAVLSGVLADYLIEDLGDGTWSVTDTVADRDGTDILLDIAQLRFSDGSTFQLVPADSAPEAAARAAGDALVLPGLTDDARLAKDADIAQILPGVTADESLLPKDANLPLVLPAEEADRYATATDVVELPNRLLTLDPTGGHEARADDLVRLHDHDDGWLF